MPAIHTSQTVRYLAGFAYFELGAVIVLSRVPISTQVGNRYVGILELMPDIPVLIIQLVTRHMQYKFSYN